MKWTREFIEKVCRSIERVKLMKSKVNAKNCYISLQDEKNNNTEDFHDDGICTQVEQDLDEQDEQDILDYDNDLSMEGENLELVSSPIIEPLTEDNEPKPGTSGYSMQQIVQEMTKQPEKLMENPVIQKMMQKFVQEQFKNLQAEQQKSGINMLDKQGINQVRSPSDTTIYTPALQKK